MKKILQLLIISALFVITCPLYAFAESASLPDITADPGESISIPLTVNDMTNLEGMGVTVTFDESVIDATGATLTGGVLDGQNYGLQVNTATDGQIVLIIYANANLYSGSGVVAYLQFDAGTSGNTDLHFTQFEVNETSYLGNTTDGSVTINGGGTDPSASLPDVTAEPGESISIPLTVNDMTNLEGMGVTVTFDESVIDATGATLTGGVLDGQNYGLQVNTATDGQIVIIIYANANLYSGSGVVAYLQFDAGLSGYTDLHFTQFEVNETSYLGNTTDGSVTINGGGTDPSASLPDVTADPGESISIPLTVNDMTNLEGMGVTVTFDESVIDATGATLTGGVLDGQNYGLQVNTATDGQIVLIIYANANLYSGSGVVAYLQFDAGTYGYTDLHFTQFEVNETSYLGNTTDGSVSINGGGTDPSASLPDVTAATGESIAIPLTVNDMTNLEGMGVTVTFDESVIDATGATLTGGVLDGLNYGLQVNTATDGQIVLIIYANANLFSGSGVVAYLEFDVVGTVGDSTDLHFIQFEVNETSYLGNTTDGSVLINVSVDDNPIITNSILNAPNPFNSSTTFNFALHIAAHVVVDVYNVRGQLIKNILNEDMLADIHSINWDGTNNNGINVPSGVYFTRIITDEIENIHKVIVIR